MTVIKLSELEPAKIEELAGRATLNGLVAWPHESIGEWWYVTSGSNKGYDHFIHIWQESNVWYGECDRDERDDLACPANRKGGKLCSHVALAYLERQREEQAHRKELEDEQLERDREAIFG